MFDFGVGWYFAYIGIGLSIGAISPLLGIGGGVFLVIIFLFLDIPASQTTGTTLACILLTTASGSISYFWSCAFGHLKCIPVIGRVP